MDISKLIETLEQLKQLQPLIGMTSDQSIVDNNMIGKYVIVRCRDAGVHTGYLESHNGRECVLTESRRLWYWKPANNQSFLSGVAVAGLHENSKVGSAVPRIHLTENCEIIECTSDAKTSISQAKDHVQ